MFRLHKIVLAISVGGAYIIWGMCSALLPTIFPIEAKSKGATASEIGLVFGIYDLAGLISSPLFGKYGSMFSPRYLYIPGAHLTAICTLSFGFLKYIENLWLFLGLAHTFRILTGMAYAAASPSIRAALITLFPDDVSKIVAGIELCWGIGYMLGPVVGGFLYTISAFLIPFEVVGSMAMVVAILLVFIMPRVDSPIDDKATSQSFGTIKLIRLPSVMLALLDTFTASFGISMVEATVGLQLKSIGATTSLVSAAFFISGGSYMISTLASGYITDKLTHPIILSILGNIGLIITFMFIGPLPLIPIEVGADFITMIMALLGFSMGLLYVSSYKRAQVSAIQNGFPPNTKTYHLISGFYLTFHFIGYFLGPSIGGVAVEWWGFRSATVIYFIVYCIIFIANVVKISYNFVTNKSAHSIDYEIIQTQN